jgi:tryptophanase
MVEPIRFTTPEERMDILERAHYNPFLIHAEDILIDLLTDSGTSAMSAAQWGAMMVADESYAGGRSFFKFEEVVRDLTGFKHIIPTHQGRAAEHILCHVLGGKGKIISSNNHFDTTRANIEYSGAEALDLVIEEGKHPETVHPFKGNLDVAKLEALLSDDGRWTMNDGSPNDDDRNTERETNVTQSARNPKSKIQNRSVPFGMLTVTNNTGGGQPVSMENIRQVSETLHRHGIPFFLDACRFAENSWFIKMREPGYSDKSPKEIAQEMFSYCDGATFSGKKDGLSNIGGFLALNDDGIAEQARNILILTEGFPTYGGLAARDLEALAVGLREILDERYLEYRHACVEYFAHRLRVGGVKIVEPPGGHAVFLDARAFLPHVPVEQYPGQALVCALYLAGGVRSVEIGSAMFGKHEPESGTESFAEMDLVRLAIPRRVYTQSHVDYLAEVVLETFAKRDEIKGLRMTYQAPILRHFTAHFEPASG